MTNFAFSDLENLYKTIIGKEIDRRNFRKKDHGATDCLMKTNNLKKEGSGRPGKTLHFQSGKI